MTEILAIRHAQASFDADDYDRLSERGEIQAGRLGAYLAADPGFGFDTLVVGAMRRHQQTLDAIVAAYTAAGRTLPEALVEPDLNEFDHGAVMAAYLAEYPDHPTWQGRMPDRADRGNISFFLAEALHAWAAGELEQHLAEGWYPFRQRILDALRRIVLNHHHGGRVLLVSSGGVIAQLARIALEVPDVRTIDFNLSLRNSAISEFRLRGEHLHLRSFNNLPHLAQPADRGLWTHF